MTDRNDGLGDDHYCIVETCPSIKSCASAGYCIWRKSYEGEQLAVETVMQWHEKGTLTGHPKVSNEEPLDAGTNLLGEAEQAVRHRRENYGSPARNFDRIAQLWNCYWQLRVEQVAPGAGDSIRLHFNSADVATMMRLVKEARLIETPDHRDSLVDIAGYADCQWECMKS